MKERPAYYAITPADVRYCKKLSGHAKLLYGEITALSNQEGFCWATNKYFAELYNVEPNTVSRWIAELTECGFITAKLGKGNAREITIAARLPVLSINKNDDRSQQKSPEPINKNDEPGQLALLDNTTSNTTTNSEAAARLCGLLFESVLDINPKEPEPQWKTWCKEMDKIIGKHSEEEVATVIAFVQRDVFWKPNILSPKKLGVKYLTLLGRMKSQGKGAQGKRYEGIDTGKFRTFVDAGK